MKNLSTNVNKNEKITKDQVELICWNAYVFINAIDLIQYFVGLSF